ncbi:MAG: hypothetical protein MJ154_01765 [Candidatus Saccharibacteria bacterium]|nr:hypothetical protein [Candidatus Saccharibacteria bacterium]
MSIDTNKPYKVPAEYEAKNKDFVPKMKASSKVIVILSGILIIAAFVGLIVAAIIGIPKIIESVSGGNSEPETSQESNQA